MRDSIHTKSKLFPMEIAKQLESKLHIDETSSVFQLKNRICDIAKIFNKPIDDINIRVSKDDNYDNLFIPSDHPSREDAYENGDGLILRTHLAPHIRSIAMTGNTRFSICGDVYRKKQDQIIYLLDLVNLSSLSGSLKVIELMNKIISELINFDCSNSSYPIETFFTTEGRMVKLSDEFFTVAACGKLIPSFMDSIDLNGNIGYVISFNLSNLLKIKNIKLNEERVVFDHSY